MASELNYFGMYSEICRKIRILLQYAIGLGIKIDGKRFRNFVSISKLVKKSGCNFIVRFEIIYLHNV